MTLPRTPSFRLDGRRALVAGGSSGIGLGAAVALAEQGAHVTLVARHAVTLAAATADFRGQYTCLKRLCLSQILQMLI